MDPKEEDPMVENELVSIVTVVRNGEKYLEQTILSVLGQTYKNVELIVIDGGSTDGTLEIIRKYESRLAYWISEPDKGMYDAINKGIKRAKGRYLAYLNSDDLYFPDTVAASVEFFRSSAETYMLFGDCDYIDGAGKFLYRYRYPAFKWRKFVSMNWMTMPQPTVFWRREVHETCGYLDPSYRMAGDFEFFSRVGRKYRVSHTGKALARFRVHGESLTAKGQALNRMEVERMRVSLGVPEGLGQAFHRYSGEAFIKTLNFPLMARKLLGWKP
jgi:glycosyltransferase involved in cell wall biosynthesis